MNTNKYLHWKKIVCIFKVNKNLILLFLLFVFFFTFPVLILWDSSHYMNYVSIFEGNLPISSWDIVRGPVFPFLIFLSNCLFGKTAMGILFLTFLFYLGMFITCLRILKLLKPQKKSSKILLYFLFMLLIVLNPIIFGYYHAMLTEFVAITVGLFSCYLGWEFLRIDYSKNKTKFVLFSIYFAIMVPFAWFLKQPYVSIVLFPLLISVVIGMFTTKNIKKNIQRVIVLIISVFSLFFSIFLWNEFLKYKNIDTHTNRGANSILGNQLLVALRKNFRIIDASKENLYESTSDSLFANKTEGSFPNEGILLKVGVYSKDKEVDTIVFDIGKDGIISSVEAFRFLVDVSINHPYLLLDSYLTNYLGIINIYNSKTLDGAYYYVEKDLRLIGCNENCSIAVGITDKKENIYYMPDNMYSLVESYEQESNSPFIFRKLLSLNKYPSIVIFNYSLLFLPFILLASILYLIIKRKELNENNIELMYLVIILLSFSFLHILAHAFTGAVLDRYASPALIPTILGYIVFCSVFLAKRKFKNRDLFVK